MDDPKRQRLLLDPAAVFYIQFERAKSRSESAVRSISTEFTDAGEVALYTVLTTPDGSTRASPGSVVLTQQWERNSWSCARVSIVDAGKSRGNTDNS